MTKQRMTQILQRAKIPTQLPKLQIQTIDVRYIGELSGHGSGLYIRVPKEIIDYYGLVAGDRVKVAIMQRKKWTELDNIHE